MEITQQIRDYAREREIDTDAAVQQGLVEKAEEFRRRGAGGL